MAVENKNSVEILLENTIIVRTFLSEDDFVNLVAVLQSGKEGLVSVVTIDNYRTFIKASQIVGVRYALESEGEKDNGGISDPFPPTYLS
jgi:hypothetical protein